MAPAIRIDDEVYVWLQEQAKPFEDTPNSVLRRIAGLESSKSELSKKHAFSKEEDDTGVQKTPQRAYREPLLRILNKHGGEAPRSQVLKELESMLGERFTTHDRRKIKTGAVRWERTAEWEVKILRDEQLIQPVNPNARGVWALTQKGKDAARKR